MEENLYDTLLLVWFTEKNHFAQLDTVNLTRETVSSGEGPYVEASTRLQGAFLLTGCSDKKLKDEVTLDLIC